MSTAEHVENGKQSDGEHRHTAQAAQQREVFEIAPDELGLTLRLHLDLDGHQRTNWSARRASRRAQRDVYQQIHFALRSHRRSGKELFIDEARCLQIQLSGLLPEEQLQEGWQLRGQHRFEQLIVIHLRGYFLLPLRADATAAPARADAGASSAAPQRCRAMKRPAPCSPCHWSSCTRTRPRESTTAGMPVTCMPS